MLGLTNIVVLITQNVIMTSECKRDATKLSEEELQELMDQTVLHLGIKSNGGKRKRRDNHKRSKRNKISKISKRNKRSIKHSYK